MSAEMLQLIGVALTAILGTLGGIHVANRAKKSTDQGTIATFAKDVVERVETLEARVTGLEQHIKVQDRVIRSFATFVDRIGLWVAGGYRGPRPIPTGSIREYIDADLWTNEPPEERSTE